MIDMAPSLILWGAHAPRVLAMAPSPSRTCSVFLKYERGVLEEVRFGDGAETSTRDNV